MSAQLQVTQAQVSQVKAFDDNYIWLIHGLTKNYQNQVIIVDPGEALPVLEKLKSNNLTPQAIFITHHHGDHIGGVRELLKQYKIPVYGPANESISVVDHPCDQHTQIEFKMLGLNFSVLDVPGHTAGHIAFLGHQSLFIGDTLFAGGCGRLFEGTYAQMHNSLSQILSLDDQTQIYCAHEYTQDNLNFAQIVEPENKRLQQRIIEVKKLRENNQATVPSVLSLEKQTNPFLRFDQNSVKLAAEKYIRQQLPQPVDVFKVTREWKDYLD